MNELIQSPDLILRPNPDAISMKGVVGQRIELSRVNRLQHQEEDHLLFAFREHIPVGMHHPDRPRKEIYGDWQGEYIGTWLDAAILSAWNAGDEQLAGKVDVMVADWLATQQEDGYLGTFDEKDRWQSWDIWVQAHDLIGLMSYYRYTGKKNVLLAAANVADRVLQDFGPGKRYLFPTGPHGGMASSAFLEPLMWLYFETGKHEYLTWAKWLVDEDWEQPDGPRIISSLNAGRGVAGTANAKGIEMLICFAGLIELYKATGNDRYLDPVLVAWNDIVQHHLYITGSASTGEYFTADFTLRNDGVYMLGETCVSMGWLYLNLKLGRLLGDSKFFDMAEQVLYNHLLAAQSPDGCGWAYYVGLRDSKRYRWHIDPECCPTRGVRALAQMPTNVVGLEKEGIAINFYDAASGEVELLSGVKVGLEIDGNYPFNGEVDIVLKPENVAKFTLRLRLPGWCTDWSLFVNNEQKIIEPDRRGYLVLDQYWAVGDRIKLKLSMPVRLLTDILGNNGKVALVRGPVVYAADSAYLPHGKLLDDVILLLSKQQLNDQIKLVEVDPGAQVHLRIPTAEFDSKVDNDWWQTEERYRDFSYARTLIRDCEVELVPFFEAGNREDPENYKEGYWTRHEKVGKITFQVWLPYAKKNDLRIDSQ